jgi:uncharacterized protein (DUF433 family)
MMTLETDMEIRADGSLRPLSALPGWLKPGRGHVRLTIEDEDAGIEKTPGVSGGDACIARTRIPIWALEEMRRAGAGEGQILADFPSLTPAQLALAWAYVKAHPDEIEEALTAHAEA